MGESINSVSVLPFCFAPLDTSVLETPGSSVIATAVQPPFNIAGIFEHAGQRLYIQVIMYPPDYLFQNWTGPSLLNGVFFLTVAIDYLLLWVKTL